VRHNLKVTRVIDADTFRGVVDLDFGISLNICVRLFDCDAWEMTGLQKSRGKKAKEFVDLLINNTTIVVDPHKEDSFGRWLCEVYVNDRSLNSILAENGHLKS
jgi:endonuclease YncB( thermonuclease family)